nr:MAG TPA_asm: hypothetical protein [Caudoviricetes sp.]
MLRTCHSRTYGERTVQGLRGRAELHKRQVLPNSQAIC